MSGAEKTFGATLVIQDVLAALAAVDLDEGHLEGTSEDGTYTWEAEIVRWPLPVQLVADTAPATSGDPQEGEPGDPRLLQANVTVWWSEGSRSRKIESTEVFHVPTGTEEGAVP